MMHDQGDEIILLLQCNVAASRLSHLRRAAQHMAAWSSSGSRSRAKAAVGCGKCAQRSSILFSQFAQTKITSYPKGAPAKKRWLFRNDGDTNQHPRHRGAAARIRSHQGAEEAE